MQTDTDLKLTSAEIIEERDLVTKYQKKLPLINNQRVYRCLARAELLMSRDIELGQTDGMFKVDLESTAYIAEDYEDILNFIDPVNDGSFEVGLSNMHFDAIMSNRFLINIPTMISFLREPQKRSLYYVFIAMLQIKNLKLFEEELIIRLNQVNKYLSGKEA